MRTHDTAKRDPKATPADAARALRFLTSGLDGLASLPPEQHDAARDLARRVFPEAFEGKGLGAGLVAILRVRAVLEGRDALDVSEEQRNVIRELAGLSAC